MLKNIFYALSFVFSWRFGDPVQGIGGCFDTSIQEENWHGSKTR